MRRIVHPEGQTARTEFHVLAAGGGVSLAGFVLHTGRTHQIRAHMAHLGHPLLGDTVYGGKKPVPGLAGQCLHARSIAFVHPETGERLSFTSPLPEYFTAALEQLGE